ncbi:DUF2189 domain-containing protein [Hyphomicrobium sp. D-2]|uniref:DUF2189 domain-containing protein n=1 Tax=Hyphomicrobium sp. D-2 TaxID=3041621 RepID=UPI00245644AF|nr:DUF2189 domain-containing protein [Hyphomicrobium sp. D-2]MDH4982998.1 DUF2189 domain-containing protein [Hyphomicrobium sp. D-2]
MAGEDLSRPNAATHPLGFPVRRVALDAPWAWLAAGWRDLCANPVLSIGLGIIFTAGGWLLYWLLERQELVSLVPVLGAGFVLISPVLAAGLYEMSRLREKGQRVTLGAVVAGMRSAIGRLALFGVALFLAFFAWVQLAFLLLGLFLGEVAVPDPSQFVHTALFTNAGLALLFAGTILGAALAAMVFSISSIGAPLLLAEDVDTVTAMATSVRAAAANIGPMLLWAALIAGHMMIGLLTLFLGLAIILPLLGHATWHAFRALTVVDDI